MPILELVIAPNKIFKQKSEVIIEITDEIKQIVANMLETMHLHDAYGMGANMVGILKRIVVIGMLPNGDIADLALINPTITHQSDETQIFEEGSICFPGIAAAIERPKYIKVEYLDLEGNKQIIEADNIVSAVLQHEIDILDGITFLDHLSQLKRARLLEKMAKTKQHIHIHGPGCKH